MKYLVVNSGYKNDIHPILSATKADLAFSYNIDWLMPKLTLERWGSVDMAVETESISSHIQMGNCIPSHFTTLNNSIPRGIEIGTICFQFNDNDLDGLKNTLNDIKNIPYKSVSVIEIM